MEICACAKWYYVVSFEFRNDFKVKCPVMEHVQFNLKQMNVNLTLFYHLGCCMHLDSLEIKSLVSGTKSLMLSIVFANNVALSLPIVLTKVNVR